MKTIYLLTVLLLFTQHPLYAVPDTSSTTPPAAAASRTKGVATPIDSDKVKLDILKKDAEILKATNKAIKDTVDTIAKKVKTQNCVYRYNDDLSCAEWWLVFLPILIFVLVIGVLLFAGLLKFNLSEALQENELTKVIVQNPFYNGQQTKAGESDVNPTIEITANVTSKPDDTLAKNAADALKAAKDASVIATTAANAYTTADATATANPADLAARTTADTAKAAADSAAKTAQTAAEDAKVAATISANKTTYTIDKAESTYRPSISRYIALISSLLIIIIAVCLSSFFIYHYISTGCPPELGALTTVLIALGIGIVPYAANKFSTAVGGKQSEG